MSLLRRAVAWLSAKDTQRRESTQELVERVALKTATDYFKSDKFGDVIRDVLAKNPRYQFTIAVARRFRAVDAAMKADDAFKLAVYTINQFLRDEKIDFGDARFSWGASAATILANEYEIDHWESRP